jgi:hypothetical protein
VNGSLCRSQIYVVTEYLNVCQDETNMSVCSGIIIVFQLCTTAFKAYCAILVRHSDFHHQASPRVSPRESTQQLKVKLWAINDW